MLNPWQIVLNILFYKWGVKKTTKHDDQPKEL